MRVSPAAVNHDARHEDRHEDDEERRWQRANERRSDDRCATVTLSAGSPSLCATPGDAQARDHTNPIIVTHTYNASLPRLLRSARLRLWFPSDHETVGLFCLPELMPGYILHYCVDV